MPNASSRRLRNRVHVIADALEPRRLLSGNVFANPLYDNNSKIVAIADFNGDGRPDTVTGVDLSVRFQTPDGQFGAANPVAPDATAVVAGNFAGDSTPDLVFNNGSLKLATNNGDGTFAPAVTIASGATVRQATDFNGDSKLDLVTTAGATVRVYLGNGAGGFTSGATATDTSVAAVTVADFNGDGKSDVATLNTSDNKLHLFLNSGGTSLVAAGTLTVGAGGTFLTSGDFDGDGKADLATLATAGISQFMNLGNASFAAPATYAAGTSVPFIASDLNQDGRDDLVYIVAGVAPSVVTRLADPVGALGAPASSRLATVSTTDGFAVADLNGDGKRDLLVGVIKFHAIAAGRGDGTFDTLPPSYSAGTNLVDEIAVDLNADGRDDLVVTNFASPGTVTVLKSNGAGFDAGVSYPAGLAAYRLASADFNGDGRPDLAVVAANLNTRQFTVLFGTAAGGFGAPQPYALSFDAISVTCADVNGDGKIDLAVLGQSHTTADDLMYVLLNDGSGGFSSPASYPVSRDSDRIMTMDFDEDGDVDLVLANVLGTVDYLLNDGHGVYGTLQTLPEALYVNVLGAFDGVKAVDLNGDGHKDLVAYGSNSNFGARGLYVFLNLGSGSFAPASRYLYQDLVYGVDAGDFNGDGYVDLAAYESRQSLPLLTLFAGDGTGAPGTPTYYSPNVPGSPKRLVAGDFNGDHKLDLAPLGTSAAVLMLNMSITVTAPALAGASFDIDTRSITFAFDQSIAAASVSTADLEVTNLTLSQTAAAQAVALSADRKSLTFTLPVSLVDGDYRFRIPAGAIAGDGGTVTTSDAILTGPTAFILGGDANRDRHVDFNDLVPLAQNYNLTGKTFSQGNFDYSVDGKVDFNDLVILAQHYNASLPALLAIVSGSASAVPTRSSTSSVDSGKRDAIRLLA